MKTLENIIKQEQQIHFDDWNQDHGCWTEDCETHPDTNLVMAVNSELLNQHEYVAYVKENKKEIVNDLLEVIGNDEKFREFLFNQFLETI